MPFQIALDTPVEKIKQIEVLFLEFLKTRPDIFVASTSGLYIREAILTNQLSIQFLVWHTTNWQFAENYFRRHLCVLKIKEICEALEISYYPPIQQVAIVDPPNYSAPPTPTVFNEAPAPVQFGRTPQPTCRPAPAARVFSTNMDM